MDELDRIRAEYARRQQDPQLQKRYSPFQPDVQLASQMRERVALKLLREAAFEPLDRFDVLEAGCGAGGVMLDLLRWGAEPSRLHGCDLLPGRAHSARRRLPPDTSISVASAGALPYSSNCFDLVLQFTVLTSVLDKGLRMRIAQEMWRVLRPGGAVLWYDFCVQGRNPAVRAVHRREVRALFAAGMHVARRVTLAPPIARRLASRWWLGCEVLSRIPWLCTHEMILIRKSEARDG